MPIEKTQSGKGFVPCRPAGYVSLAALACAAGLFLITGHLPAAAQSATGVEFSDFGQVDETDQMLVEADELIFDQATNEVSAVGNVQIYYGELTLQADQVIYNQTTARVRAEGNVRITEADGNVIFANEIDLADDFRDGFVRSLTIETPQNTTISAANAERQNDNTTIFNRGVYTACPRCEDNPEKPPFWQVKSVRIIHDQEARTIIYENASLEFFGIPVAYLPVFTSPDPTVSRRSGFLTPTARFTDLIEAAVAVPYFWNIAPNRDLTFSPLISSRQGVMPQLEYRHRTQNGNFSINTAGIYQLDPEESGNAGNLPDNPGDDEELRGYVNTRGNFQINDMWSWGWDATAVSDDGFLDSYGINSSNELESKIFLTGLSERNYFDVRANHFRELNTFDFDQNRLPVVHPSFDYNYIFDRPVLGGELAVDAIFYSLSRDGIEDAAAFADLSANGLTASDYADGTRFSTEVSWQRNLIDPVGQVFVPFASVRGDVFSVSEGYNAGRATAATIGTTPQDTFLPVTYEDEQVGRFIPTVGVEYRFPLAGRVFGQNAIIEPIAQIYYRPDLDEGEVNIANEDSLSLVFDTTSLFERDKFSGYDRVETGLRANVGMRITSTLPEFGLVNLVFGQSYHLAGDNPFPMDSGLEHDRSDFVASLTLDTPQNITLGVQTRLDEETLSLERLDAQVKATLGALSGTVQYANIDSQPGLGVLTDQEQISLIAALDVSDEWSISGGMRYDIELDQVNRNRVAVNYANECFALSFGVQQDFAANGDESYAATFAINLRTLGGIGSGSHQTTRAFTNSN